MKLRKLTALLVAFVMLLGMLPAMAAEPAPWKTIYVSPTGSDTGDGTSASPFRTLARAQEAVRAVNSSMQGDIVVEVAKGTYRIDEPLSFRKEDGGTNGHRVIWRGIDRPLISGGKEITGFVPSADHPGLYEANVDGIDRIMQIYVDGKKRYMARSNQFVKGVTKPQKYDNKDWYDAHPNDVEGDSYNWHDVNSPYRWDGIYMSKEDIGFWENPNDILFQWERDWKTQITYPEEIMQDPDNPDQVIVRMQRGFWQIMLACNYSGQVMYPDGGVYFRIINAMELLDSPGEFYYNRTTKKLYYMPEEDEDMSKVSVVVPRESHFATIYGNDYNDCVKNITFEGFDIAHFASNAIAEGYWGEQGTVVRQASGTAGVGRCGIYMFFCDSVNFYDNYFYGFDGVCINMQSGIYNCEVTGNAFSDISDAAVNVGHERHIGDNDYIPPANKKQLILTRDNQRTALYTSYIGDDYLGLTNYIGILLGTGITGDIPNRSYVPDDGYQYKGRAWHSDPVDAQNGEKSYVMYDFYDKYSIDKIALCWDNDLVTPQEKANFEVLVSNDISFAEGTYTTIATETASVSGEVKEYEINDDAKYRYLMIRTLGATPLALSAVYALTSDMKPYTYGARPKNITISNNYITRIGGDIPRSCGVMVYYVDGIDIVHNELYDISYSGFEIGWGWSTANTSCRNVYCAYNSIDTTNHFLYDGGPIYTLSRQPNSVYEYNYTDNNILGVNTLYQDSGTASTTWRNNVVENAHYIVSPYNDDNHKDNVFQNNYASHNTSLLSPNAKLNNVYEEAKAFAMGQPPKQAWEIIRNAGLEPDYEYLIALVPEDVDNGLPEEAISYIRVDDYGYRSTYGKMHKQEAENMLSMGVFGTDFGTYPVDYYAELKEANNAFTDSPTVNQTVLMRNLMNDIKESVKRMSLEDTMAAIGEELEGARIVSDNCPCITSFGQSSLYDTFGMMTEGNYEKLSDRYDDLASKVKQGTISEYTLLTTAEALYTDVLKAKFSADIVYATAEGARDVSINNETREIVIYFGYESGLSGKNLDITVSPGAVIAANIPANADLSTPVIVPIYCNGNKGYRYWMVRGEYVSIDNTSYTSADNWFSLRPDGKHVSKSNDGSLIVEHGAFATMSKGYDINTKGASFNFMPMSGNTKNKFTMVLASQSYEIDNTLKGDAVNRLEIDFENNIASLYKVTSTGRTLIRQAYTTLSYNAGNSISFSSEAAGNQTNVKVTLNGETIFNELVSESLPAAYFGFVSGKINIKIY